MAIISVIFRRDFYFTDPGLGTSNRRDRFTLADQPDFSSSVNSGAVYVGSAIAVDKAFGLEQLPTVASQPLIGERALNQSIDVDYFAAIPFVSHCSYRLSVVLALPTDENGLEIPVSETKIPRDGRIIVFEQPHFRGAYRVLEASDADLSASHGGFAHSGSFRSPSDGTADVREMERGFMNDKISSFIVANGNWMPFRHVGFQNAFTKGVGALSFARGLYPTLLSIGIPEDAVSSILLVS